MFAIVAPLESLTKSLLRAAVVLLLGAGGWLGYSLYSARDRVVEELSQQLDARLGLRQ
jgi:hypothetical protein